MTTPALERPPRPAPRHRASDLLAAYLPGSFFYSSTRGALLADGVHATVPTGSGPRATAVAEALEAARAAGVRDPLVVGALGFGPDAESSLVVPAVVRRADPLGAAPPAEPGLAESLQGWAVRQRPAPEEYEAGVRRALALIDDGGLRKVVLARCLELTAGQEVPVPALLRRLARANPTAHAFAVDVTAPGDPATRTLVGASPELLVSRRGSEVVANPLAGSLPRVPGTSAEAEAENRRRVAALRASDKDRREHALVAAQVGEVLGRFCTDLHVPAEPEVIGTPTMWHLSSRITGRLPDGPAVSSLALAEALHPTPAVCGVPVPEARAVIADLEPVDRGYFTGLVGWTGPDGDGEWVVTIRSAEVSERTVRLFAGAGIVEGSQPEAELAETSAKFRTLLRAIGMEDE
ncbi:isochorismate synthase DhbC [Pseudonocardia halophobica]|uniref:isochorismate synthase n=1 Tax=Pseudonocardia halophobica TaxID=29401 RepID=A0A9W6NYN7_9PSEU|nr:isochorismate synthase [Pseudonocardia halophobica]GLL13931.1 isochorismate synthase DhbC [Pseudonocardia halophobica]